MLKGGIHKPRSQLRKGGGEPNDPSTTYLRHISQVSTEGEGGKEYPKNLSTLFMDDLYLLARSLTCGA